jgi:hypothetical protein
MSTSNTPGAPAAWPSDQPPPYESDFERIRVQPPSGAYVTRTDQLVVVIYNATAGVSVEIRARILTPEGAVTPHVWTIVPTSARARHVTVIDVPEGFIIGLSAALSAGTSRRGATFVQVSLGRGPAAQPLVLQTLLSDYVTPDAAIAYPGGLVRQSIEGPGVLRAVTGTDQAAGTEISETVPTGARWRLRAFRAALVTSAVAGARRVHLYVDDGATRLFELAAADTQAASLARNYNATPDGYARAAQDSEIYVPLPFDVALLQGWRIRTVTTLFDGGDNWGAPELLVEESIEA